MHHGDVHFDHRSPQMTGSRQRPKSPEPSQNHTETNDPNISPNDSMIPNVQFASICHMSAISAITMKLSPPTRHPHGPARLRSKSRRPSRAMAPHPNVPDCEAPAANPMPFLPPTGDGSKNTHLWWYWGRFMALGLYIGLPHYKPFHSSLDCMKTEFPESNKISGQHIYIYMVHLRMVSCVNVIAKNEHIDVSLLIG